MYSIGVDFHKAYSHMTVMDAQGQVVRAGKVPNTVEAVQAFVAPYRENAQAVLEATRNWTCTTCWNGDSAPCIWPTR
jgi:hypothetical protein